MAAFLLGEAVFFVIEPHAQGPGQAGNGDWDNALPKIRVLARKRKNPSSD